MTPSKVVLVTGASRGLGRAIAVAFGAAGYAVAVNYSSNKVEAEKTTQQIRGANGTAEIFQADVRSSNQVNAMVVAVEKKWGRIDVLVNNAGNVHNRTVAKMSDNEWRDVMAVNLDGPFYCMRAAIPIFRKHKSGSIVNITSYIAVRGARGGANYAASKAALINLTKSVATEEGRNNIRANAVMPGFHVTDLNTDTWAKLEREIREQHLLSEMPNRNEMAKFVVTVAELRTVTGQVFSFESRLV